MIKNALKGGLVAGSILLATAIAATTDLYNRLVSKYDTDSIAKIEQINLVDNLAPQNVVYSDADVSSNSLNYTNSTGASNLKRTNKSNNKFIVIQSYPDNFLSRLDTSLNNSETNNLKSIAPNTYTKNYSPTNIDYVQPEDISDLETKLNKTTNLVKSPISSGKGEISMMGSGDGILNPAITNDANIDCTWIYNTNSVGDLTGHGYINLYNGGLETRIKFEWPIAKMLTITPPSGWLYSYNPTNNILKLEGDTDELQNSENIDIDFTFNPTNVVLTYGNLAYYGAGTDGIVTNIGITFPQPKITAMSFADSNCLINLSDLVQNQIYNVQTRTNLLDGNWTNETPFTASNTMATITNNIDVNPKFYRITR